MSKELENGNPPRPWAMSRKRSALCTGTAVLALAVGIYVTPLSVNRALAVTVSEVLNTGDVDLTIEDSIYTQDDTAVTGIAVTGKVDIDTSGGSAPVGSVTGSGIFGAALTDGDVTIDSGDVSAGAGGVALPPPSGDILLPAPYDIYPVGGGVIAYTTAGTATVNTHGNISVDGGTFGAAAISYQGEANLNLNGVTIDPPLIGGAAIVLNGGGDANITTGAATIDALDIGLLGLNGGYGNVNINAEGATIGAIDKPATGIVGYALYGGSVNIDAATSTINAGTGISGTAFSESVTIDSGVVNATGIGSLGFGVIGVSGLNNGDVVIATHGNTTATGFAGVAANAGGGNAAIDLLGHTVTAANGTGVTAIAGYDVNIAGEGSTVIGARGISGVSTGYDDRETTVTGGNVNIDSGVVSATGADVDSTGVFGQANYGNVRIATHGSTTADGSGVVAYASGNVDIDLLGNTVTAANGAGVYGAADGDVNVQATGSTINALGTGIYANGTNVIVDSGNVTAANGSGVYATAAGGDATVVTHGKIIADNGDYGAVAFSEGGNATVTVNAAIDPPAIGAAASTLGSGTATVINNSSVEATGIGLLASNLGSGNVVVTNNGTVGAGPVNPAPFMGIRATNDGPGATTITNAKGAQVYALGSAIGVSSSDPGAGNNDIAIYNDGLLKGDGGALGTIITEGDGSLSLVNDVNGLITTNQTVPTTGDILQADAGGTIAVQNSGIANGTLALNAQGSDVSGVSVDLNNTATGKWNFSGTNNIVGDGDIRVTNAGSITATTASLSTFSSDNGDISIANSGALNTSGTHEFAFVHPTGISVLNNSGSVNVNGALKLTGLDNFNNAKLLNSKDGDVLDTVRTSGNFNAVGAGSVLGFDAQLKANGVADVLTVDGNVTGITKISVNDAASAVPGQLVTANQAIVFAYVGGTTSAATPNFTTNGGIDKGLFRFDAYLRNNPVNALGYKEWVLASTPDREAFEIPIAEYAAQNLWHVSTGTWLDRTADLRSAFTGGNDGTAGNVTPGVWLRAFGGRTEREFSNSVGTPAGLSGGGTYTYDGKFRQTTRGFMAGLDFGPESKSASGENQAWLFGLMGGYTDSNVKFRSSGTRIDLSQASVGGYITRLDGPLFIDMVVKADFGKIDYQVNDGAAAGSFKSGYTSIGAMIDTGYRLPVGGRVFIEPKATLSYVHTEFDNATLLGTGVGFKNGESLRGRLGLRVGASLPSGNGVIEPYIEGSAWREFKGGYGVNLSSAGNNLPIGYDVKGTFGEAAVGVSYANRNSGLSVFARGTMQFGEDKYRSYTGNIGLRYQWGRHAALAPVAPTPPAPALVVEAPAPMPQQVCNKGPYLVFFDWNKADITSEAVNILNSAVTAYGTCTAVPIMLAGYTDRSGSDAYNIGLAARRNNSVRGYLATRGVPESEISSQAFGEASPRVPTADGVRELQNRRVEITYGPGSGN